LGEQKHLSKLLHALRPEVLKKGEEKFSAQFWHCGRSQHRINDSGCRKNTRLINKIEKKKNGRGKKKDDTNSSEYCYLGLPKRGKKSANTRGKKECRA